MTDSLAAEARRLRTVELLSARQIRDRLGIGKDKLYELLRGVSAPEWTRRPNAKDDLHTAALKLRGDGWSVNDIAVELGVAKSTAYQWVKHISLDTNSERAKERGQQAQALRNIKIAERREAREAKENDLRGQAANWVGDLDLRELLFIGAIMYWCEGSKTKPHRKQRELDFINSDPRLVELFLRFVQASGRDRHGLRYRLSIHETADVEAAGRWWAAQLGLDAGCFRRPVIKRHNPLTVRLNTGEDYRGCLIVRVPRSRDLYVWIEGVIEGLFDGARSAGFSSSGAAGLGFNKPRSAVV